MSGKASRDKGCRGEVEILHLLRDCGIEAWSTRSTQAASCRKWDIEWEGCNYAVEVKIGKSWSLGAAWRQVMAAAEPSGRVPVLLARRDRGQWYAWRAMCDWPRWCLAVMEQREVDGMVIVGVPVGYWLIEVCAKSQAGRSAS